MMAASGTDTATLADSRAYCESLTREQARNFYYGLKLLPEPKRSAMFALYAYMRLVDDIADSADNRSHAQRSTDLRDWREKTHGVLDHPDTPVGGSPFWPAFADMVRTYALPRFIFDEVIAGQQQDLESTHFETFAELNQYCYRVAGVVGLGCLHIWGFTGGDETCAMALDRGVAFQLTNILRDVREDASKGRLYFPRGELKQMDVRDEDLLDGTGGAHFLELMNFQIERAQGYYEKSSQLEERIERDCRPTLVAMTAIYHGLLRKVARRPERVLHQRVSLSLPSKLFIGWRALRAR